MSGKIGGVCDPLRTNEFSVFAFHRIIAARKRLRKLIRAVHDDVVFAADSRLGLRSNAESARAKPFFQVLLLGERIEYEFPRSVDRAGDDNFARSRRNGTRSFFVAMFFFFGL